MKIILAQGNPGTRYEKTRHNIGFAMLDMVARQAGVTFSDKAKFHASISELTLHKEKVLLVKPTTFYNETGSAARALCDFYKLDPATDLIVIHDDLTLPFGTIRTREKGRDAGNNGIKSLNAHIGESYKRVRIGIYNDLRDRMNDVDFVLGAFSRSEYDQFDAIFQQVDTFVAAFLQGSFSATKITLATTPPEVK